VSETVRSYTPPPGFRRKRRQRKVAKRRGFGCLYVFALAAILAGLGAWLTRDTCPLQQLVPRDRTYHIVLLDLLNHRGEMAASPVWDALPDAMNGDMLRDTLSQRGWMPDWILNNLIGRTCYVTGNDLDEFGDALFITRMSRVGRIVEAGHLFLPGIRSDSAGGLRLRHLRESGLYYAVRGRMLVVSPSREALVRTLTLTEPDRINPGVLDTALSDTGTEQVRGILTPGPDDPLGAAVESASFALQIDSAGARVQCRAALRPEWRDRLESLAGQAVPVQLPAALPGMLQVSVNMGISLQQTVYALGDALEIPSLTEERWGESDEPRSEEQQANIEHLRALLGMAGPGVTASMHGIDLNEILPLPELVFAMETNPTLVQGFFEALPDPPASAKPWDPYPRYDTATGVLRVPAPWGPSLEPTLAVRDGRLLVSTSANAAAALFDAPANASTEIQRGNIHLRAEPHPLGTALTEAGRLLARDGLLKGFTLQSYDAWAAAVLAKARILDEASLTASFEPGGISVECVLKAAGNIPDTL
jgi:hypothetical protein